MSASRPAVSVIVPCHEGRATIEACLSSVLAQDVSDDVEVLVVDSSTDGSAAVIEHRFPAVRLLRRAPGRTPPGVARNAGAAEARGRVLVFLDADCVAGSEWLEKLVDAQRITGGLVGGSVVPRRPCSWVGCLLHALSSSSFLPGRGWRSVPFVCGASFAVARDVFVACGGFPDALERAEDVALGAVLANAGPVVFVRDATVAHQWRTSFSDALEHQRVSGYWSARARALYPLEGASLLRAPALTPLLVPLRFGRITARLLSSSSCRWLLSRWLGLLPLSLTLLVVWALGFLQGARRGSSS